MDNKQRLGVVDEDTNDDNEIQGEEKEIHEDDGEKIGNESKEDNDEIV